MFSVSLGVPGSTDEFAVESNRGASGGSDAGNRQRRAQTAEAEASADANDCPLLVELPVAAEFENRLEDFVCRYQNTSSYSPSQEQTEGMVLLRFEERSGGIVAICASTHLTDFVSVVKRDLPTVNRVNPVDDSGILRNYLKPENYFPLIIISVLLGAFLLAWIASAVMEGYTTPEMRKLRQAHMLHFGRIRKEMGMEHLHLEDQLEVYLKVLAAHTRNLRKMRRKRAERATAAALSTRSGTAGFGGGSKVVPQAAQRYSVGARSSDDVSSRGRRDSAASAASGASNPSVAGSQAGG